MHVRYRRRVLAWAALTSLAGSCGSRVTPGPPQVAALETPPPASSTCPAALVTVARIEGDARFYEGAGRVALYRYEAELTDDYRVRERSVGWFDVGATGLQEHAETGRRIAAVHDGRAPDHASFLGHAPIASYAADGAWQHVRATAAPQPVLIDGELSMVVALADGTEAWLLRHDHVDRIAMVASDGTFTVLPTLGSIGPEIPGLSEVGEQVCAAPLISGLAGRGSELSALLVGCHLEAPVRLVTYRRGEPASIVELPSLEMLGFVVAQLMLTATGPVLVGMQGAGMKGTPAIARPVDGDWVITSGSPPGTLRDAAASRDGAIWTVSSNAAGDRELRCDGSLVTTRSPDGQHVQVHELAADDDAGAVVLAGDDGARWLFAENGPGPAAGKVYDRMIDDSAFRDALANLTDAGSSAAPSDAGVSRTVDATTR